MRAAVAEAWKGDVVAASTDSTPPAKKKKNKAQPK
jgi:hypothetical protein